MSWAHAPLIFQEPEHAGVHWRKYCKVLLRPGSDKRHKLTLQLEHSAARGLGPQLPRGCENFSARGRPSHLLYGGASLEA